MAKIKKIDLITKGSKSELTDTYKFREKRVRRVISDMITQAEENALTEEYEAQKALNNLKEGADKRERIVCAINNYIDHLSNRDSYNKSIEYLKALQTSLDEEVDVEDAED